MRATIALAVALWAGTAAAQYPYPMPPAWGYMTKAEAMQQQAFENRLRLHQHQWQVWQSMNEDPLSFARRAVELRVLKEQERQLRNLNQRMEANPFNSYDSIFR